uniref:Uncharacterized protein n=1 Tax=Hyaloperonospora arabidopsidis (strain Emoy2) TaxID=559515 RepID=M4BS02_HYAAE
MEEAEALNAAGDNPSAASAAQPAAVAAVRSRGDAPRDIGDYNIELIYSDYSDGDTDLKKAATKKYPDVAEPESTDSASRSAINLAEHSDIFGSFDESDASSQRRSRSLESDRGGGLGQFNDDDGDAVMRQDQDDRTGCGVGNAIDTTQEAKGSGILRVAPEKKAWLPP